MAGGGGLNNTGFSAEHDTKHSLLFNTKSLISQLDDVLVVNGETITRYTLLKTQASQDNEHNGYKIKLTWLKFTLCLLSKLFF